MNKSLVCPLALLFVFACKDGETDSKAPPPPGGEKAETATAKPDKPDTKKSRPAPPAEPADKFAIYAPLDVGADYKGWPKLNKTPVKSKTHGGRFVDTYVNDVGAAAYKSDDAEIPVGTVIVKTSWEVEDGKATEVAGPIFVMERRAGKDGGEASWSYGLHWEKVPAKWQDPVGGPQAYWRTPSAKVGYCSECHDNYDRELGGIPKTARAY